MVTGESMRPDAQLRLLVIGAGVGTVGLVTSLVVQFGGHVDPGEPRMPEFPTFSGLPSGAPGEPTLPDLDLPTDLSSLELPSLPEAPGDGS